MTPGKQQELIDRVGHMFQSFTFSFMPRAFGKSYAHALERDRMVSELSAFANVPLADARQLLERHGPLVLEYIKLGGDALLAREWTTAELAEEIRTLYPPIIGQPVYPVVIEKDGVTIILNNDYELSEYLSHG